MMVVLARDITRRQQAEEKVKQLATHDSLTGLHNRLLFADLTLQAISNARRNHTKIALFFVDLDNFKPVNDSLGHNAGDQILKRVANRLKDNFRESDTIGRHGGDEFTLLLSNLKEDTKASVMADKVLKVMSMPFVINDENVTIGCSIGIALFPEHGETLEALLENADAAMYLAKAEGGNTYKFASQIGTSIKA